MTRLADLWFVSLGLSLSALLIIAILIVARFVSEQTHANYQVERRRLLPMLLAGVPDEILSRFASQRPKLFGQLTTDLIRLVRGDERATLVATATRLGFADHLRHQLRRGSARARITAAEMMADFPDEHCTAALKASLEDRDSDVRLAAALSLASSGRAPPASDLITLLGLGEREQSMMVATLLAEIARDRPGEIRALVVAADVPQGVKAAAIEALASSGDYSLVPIITQLALRADEDAPELPRFLRALGTLQHPAAATAIEKNLFSPIWWVRAAAAEAAGRIGLKNTGPRLVALLDDSDWWVRFRAGEALSRLGDDGRQLLGDTVRSGVSRARKAAVLTLAELVRAA